MKEQINKLARGEFVYAVPDMSVSSDNIEMNIAVNSFCSMSFQISSDSEIKGVVYSTNYRVSIENSSFFGAMNDIKYSVDTTGLTPGEHITGAFNIVSNAKELPIPYNFKVMEKSIETSMGKIHNLFHFANLAQTEPEEAKELFLSEDFAGIFLKDDIALNNIYSILRKSSSTGCAIEEFLIAVHKKSMVSLKLSSTEKKYEDFTESYKDTLYITKSTWGYVDLDIFADADFIELSIEHINSEQFTGNRFELDYVLNLDKMHSGKNFGRITVKSLSETLTLDIYVDNTDFAVTTVDDFDIRRARKAVFQLTKEYINFRTKKINTREWAENSNKIMDGVRAADDSNVSIKLYQAQVYFAQDRIEDGKWMLGSVRDEILADREDVFVYCYYLYVDSISRKDNEYSREVYDTISHYFDNGYDDWRILWILFYINEDFDKNLSIKLARIKEQFHKGCISPIMYLEACNIINAQPMLLRVLNEFEIQVLNFGCKYNILNDKVVAQVCEIVNSGKVAPKIYIRILNSIYNKLQDDNILTVLCTHMIRNEMIGPQYFDIYEKSILRGLRITGLYEYYMECADVHNMHQFPKMVLMYFNYESQLSYEKNAYLYANIIVNKENDSATYLSYQKKILSFALEQIQLERINDNLMIVYKDILDKSVITRENASFIAKILFSYKVVVFDESILYLIVKHKESIMEEKIPINNGYAYAQLYSDNYSIAFEDSMGNRRKDSIHYELENAFGSTELLNTVFDYCKDELLLSIYYCEQNLKYQKFNAKSNKLQNRLLNDDNVEPIFKKDLTENIINYYYSEYVGEDFKSLYLDIEREQLNENSSTKLIEACIINSMYEDAYYLCLIYEFQKVLPKRMFRMVRYMIELNNYEYNDNLIKMCEFIFVNKKYDDSVLEYMVSHYNNSNELMIEVWQACLNFNVESYELEERILSQMLFTYDITKDSFAVFEKYCSTGAKERVVEAFLAFNCYQYFIKDIAVNQMVFEAVESRIIYNSDITSVCKLALLKFYSTFGQTDNTLNENQLELAKSILYEMCKKNVVFEFYKNFQELFSLPYSVVGKTIVEYRTNPDNKVVISYSLDNNESTGKYVSENMKNTFEGIYTKEFNLFYGDTLQYYISDTSNGNTVVSDNNSVLYNNINFANANGRFDYINDMLASKELHDMVTLKKLMHGYSVENYVTQQLFKPL